MDKILEGQYVHYTSSYGSIENGRVKSSNEKFAWVVFKCDNDWNNFKQYTGNRISLSYLTPGWVDEHGVKIDTPIN